MTPSADAEDFPGTERFSVLRRLGSGAFGVVYESYDQEMNSLVALKVLRQEDPTLLYHFKQEFRALTDVSHPNLVQLHELHTQNHRWFFTMELVYGKSFLDYLRGPPAEESGPPVDPFASTVEVPRRPAPTRPIDYDGLRALLRQLVSGVGALHAAGKLHRDIKPSNVIVTDDGRVVVLDFGLVSELSRGSAKDSSFIAGTPAYMSPEQASGQPMSEASDWYSAGVMLYEALTGRPPLTGSAKEIFLKKQNDSVVPPATIEPATPADLDALCFRLLQRDPESRPDHAEILRLLAVRSRSSRKKAEAPPVSPLTAPLVGREKHLERMNSAFEAVRMGQTVTLRIRGSSGMGKSALVRRFLEDLSGREKETVILAGRCYERESVPYKALDSLIDALSQYLRRLSPALAAEILPRDILALTRLFPTLRRVGAVASARRRVLEIPDLQELRRRAFAAMRDLIGRLAERGPLVLFIDDLQWADADSALLLGEILRPPDAPALLLIESFREETLESPYLKIRNASISTGDTIENLLVSELEFSAACRLGQLLLGGEDASTYGQGASIARESGGNPFFIRELVQYRAENEHPSISELTLDRLILARVGQLTEPARRLLETVAVAGKPLSVQTAREAAEVEGEEQAAMAPLRSGRLIRSRDTGAHEEIEIFHDRFRPCILGHLTRDALQAHHRRLAAAIEASDRADAETLAHHFEEAGDVHRAAAWAGVAADQASVALAFDRAVNLYRRARILQRDVTARQNLSVKLGDALAKAGRGAEAAREYLAALAGASAAESLEMNRRAAEQFLISGHIEEGLSVIRTVLGKARLRFAQTPRQALLSALLRQAWLRLRGLSFRERDSTQISAEKLTRIDICWSAAKGLSLVDPLRGYDFQLRHLLLALKAGEPFRISRALAIQSGHSAARGRGNRKTTGALIEKARALATRIGNPHAEGLAISVAGTAAYLEGRWRDCRELMTQAESILRERCQNVAWELSNSHYYFLLSLYFLGEIKELSRMVPLLVEEAKERGNLFAATNLRTRFSYLLDLARDDPKSAGEGLRDAILEWPSGQFLLQHWYEILGQVQTSIYAGRGERAWNEIQRAWPPLKKSLLLRAQSIRINSLHLRARAALAAASEKQETRPVEELLGAALADARRIEHERAPWGAAFAALIRAGAAARLGNGPEAAALFKSAETSLLAADMPLFAAAARRRRGLLEGESGVATVLAADEMMKTISIRNPARMAALLAP